MKKKKKIIVIIAIVIILFTIIVAFFVKGNIFTKVENKNVSEKNKTKEELWIVNPFLYKNNVDTIKYLLI